MNCAIPNFQLGPVIMQSPDAHLRDPSGVLFFDGRFHCWPTRVGLDVGKRDGYWGTVWHFSATDLEGPWEDCGPAVEPSGKTGAYDGLATYTADAIRDQETGEWFLFYSAVPLSFTNERTVAGFARTQMAVARSDGPDGPWEKLPQNPIILTGDKPTDWDGMRVDEPMPMVIAGQRRLYMRGVQLVSEAPFLTRQLPGMYTPEDSGSWNTQYRRYQDCPLTTPPNGVRGFEGYAYFPGPDGLLHMISVNPIEGPPDQLGHAVSVDGLSWRHLEPIHLENPGGYTYAPHPVWPSALPGTDGGPVDHLVTQMQDADGRLVIQLVSIEWSTHEH